MERLLSTQPSTFDLSVYFRILFPNGSMVSCSSLIMNFLTPPTFQRPAKIFVKVLGGVDSSSADPIALLHLDTSLSRLVKEGVVFIRADNN